MRIGILSSLMALLAGVGPALAQATDTPATSSPAAAGSTATAPQAPSSLPPTLAPVPAPAPVPPPVHGTQPFAPGCDGCQGNANCKNGYLADLGPGFGPAPMGNTLYGSAEVLVWKIKDAPLPPTQLTVPFTVSGLNQFQSTFSLSDGATIPYGGRTGGRFTLGAWCHPDQLLGVEATYFQFDRHNNNFGANQIADLPLALSVIQNITTVSAVATTIQQVPLAITLPAELNIKAVGSTGPSNFWGAEINARSTRCIIGGMSIDLLAGFRYLDFEENFSLGESINLSVANAINLSGPGPIPPNPLPPIPQPITGLRSLATITTVDSISTRNQFYGAQVGASFDWWLAPRVVINGWGKVATGGLVESVRLVGSTTTTAAAGVPQPLVSPGGLLTPATGFVDNSHTRYVVVPEVNINVGYQLTSRLRAMVGYNFLYLSSVVRPGEQIGFSSTNTTISVAGTPSNVQVTQPSFRYMDSDLWVQGLTAGFQFRY